MSNRSLTRRRFVAAIALGASAAIAFAPRVTLADAKPKVDILVIAAKSDPKGGKMDPALAKYPQLTQPPISAYNSFKLLDQKTLPMDQARASDPGSGKPMARYALANGRTLEVILLGTLDGGRRFQVAASIAGSGKPDVIKYTVPADETVFVAGQSYEGGVLVVGITLRP